MIFCAAAVGRGRILERRRGDSVDRLHYGGHSELDCEGLGDVKRLPVRLLDRIGPGVISPGKAKIGIMPGGFNRKARSGSCRNPAR